MAGQEAKILNGYVLQAVQLQSAEGEPIGQSPCLLEKCLRLDSVVSRDETRLIVLFVALNGVYE